MYLMTRDLTYLIKSTNVGQKYRLEAGEVSILIICCNKDLEQKYRIKFFNPVAWVK